MQGSMPREIKDIIRNVQQMDLPENGIADIRIKIQGGDVMDRPMFKKGGGANKFPDLSGDGKVTQKDILIGRGVIEKQEGGGVRGPFGEGGYDITTSLIRDPETNKLISEKEYNAKYPPAAPPEKTIFEKIKEAAKGLTNFQSAPYLFGNEELQDRYFDLLVDEYSKAAEKGPEETLRFISETEMPRAFRTGFLQLYKRDFGPDFGQKPKDMAEGGAVNPEQAIAQVEMAAEAEGEQLGLDYLAQQMGGIDMAQDAEGLINALRGNEMPISARRTELAGYVGKEDAMRTPESVLAMVQPTIMMTEEGAMNSGIGELMQQLTSDVEMATEGGAPTDMGQGVGALMMAGAPEQPVQQFAAGGAVQYFADGTPPPVDIQQLGRTGEEMKLSALRGLESPGVATDLQDYFDAYLPMYQNLIRDEDAEENRKKDRALALAKAGFRFASGVGAKGENIAGQPLLSQAAAAAIPAIDDIAKIETEARKEDKAIRTLAASAATKAQASAQEKRDKRYELQYGAGQELSKIALTELIKSGNGTVKARKNRDGSETLFFVDNRGNASPVDIDISGIDTDDLDLSALLDAKGKDEMKRSLFEALPSLTAGQGTAEQVQAFDNYIESLYPEKKSASGPELVTMAPQGVLNYIADRLRKGEDPAVSETLKQVARQNARNPEKVAAEQTDNEIGEFEDLFDAKKESEKLIAGVDPEEVPLSRDVDPSQQYGVTAGLYEKFNSVLETFDNELNMGTAGTRSKYKRFFTDKEQLDTLIRLTNVELLEGVGSTRLKGVLDQIIKQTEGIKPGVFVDDRGVEQRNKDITAKVSAEKILTSLERELSFALNVLNDSKTMRVQHTAATLNDARLAAQRLPPLIRGYRILIGGFDMAGSGQRTASETPRMRQRANQELDQTTREGIEGIIKYR